MLISNLVDETQRTWQPTYGDTSANALDVHENDHQYIVTTVLPGVQVDNVKLHNDRLTIEGEIAEHTMENARWLMRERVDGRFSCTVRFPQPVNWYAVEASFKNGVLTVMLPKAGVTDNE